MKYLPASLLLFFLFSVQFASAQLPVKLPVGGSDGIGKMLTQFAGSLQPSAFTPAWGSAKGGVMGILAKVKTAADAGKSIGQLAGFIKPDQYKSGFSVDNLIKTANTVNTLSSAAGLLKTFEGGLKPEAFNSGWSQKRSGWLTALNLIK